MRFPTYTWETGTVPRKLPGYSVRFWVKQAPERICLALSRRRIHSRCLGGRVSTDSTAARSNGVRRPHTPGMDQRTRGSGRSQRRVLHPGAKPSIADAPIASWPSPCRLGVLRHIRHGAYAPASIIRRRGRGGPASGPRSSRRWPASAARSRSPGVSAAAAHGLCVLRARPGPVQISSGSTAGSSRQQGAGPPSRRARRRRPSTSSSWTAVPVTNLARTVWEVAGRLQPGGRESPRPTRRCAVDPSSADELAEIEPDLRVPTRLPSRPRGRTPGRRPRRRVPVSPTAACCSTGYGVPMPELQYPVLDADGRAGRHLRLLLGGGPPSSVSSTGRSSTAAVLRPGETPGDAVFREKRREDRVRGAAVRHEPVGLGRPVPRPSSWASSPGSTRIGPSLAPALSPAIAPSSPERPASVSARQLAPRNLSLRPRSFAGSVPVSRVYVRNRHPGEGPSDRELARQRGG